MHLITFAHKGEARAFIHHLAATQVEHHEHLWQFKQGLILITGEGIEPSMVKTALVLGSHPQIEMVLNFGVAGTLKNHPIHSLHPVRHVYLSKSTGPHFKSFPLNTNGLDLVSSEERILTPEKASPLKTMADMVDRELWGIAYACHEKGVPLQSFKFISDVAGSLNACELVKESADFASEVMFEKYLQLNFQNDTGERIKPLTGFYLTHYQTHEVEKLLKSLTLRLNQSTEQILDSLPIKNWQEQIKRPKDLSKKLIDELKKQLDPIGEQVREELKNISEEFTKKNISLHFDPELENTHIKIHFTLQNQDDLKNKIDHLYHIPWKRIENLIRGGYVE